MSDQIELEYQGRPIIVTGGSAPLRRYRGFFSGDDWDPHGAHDPGTPDAPHADAVTVEYGGQVFELHRTPAGHLHSHDLPTQSFDSVQEAAETLARLADEKIISGRPAQPEPS